MKRRNLSGVIKGEHSEAFSLIATIASAASEPWMVSAVCASVDPELFFPEKGGSTRDPKRVCAHCPVLAECLNYALDNDIQDGVWGMTSPTEREKLNSPNAAYGCQSCPRRFISAAKLGSHIAKCPGRRLAGAA